MCTYTWKRSLSSFKLNSIQLVNIAHTPTFVSKTAIFRSKIVLDIYIDLIVWSFIKQNEIPFDIYLQFSVDTLHILIVILGLNLS